MTYLLLVCLAAPNFVNVAESAGLTGFSSGRAVFVDLNADGRLDVVLDRQHFFRQAENGRFEKLPPLPAPSPPGLLLFADFDNDGDLDCFAGYFTEPENPKRKNNDGRNTLYRNTGDGWVAVPLKMPRTSVHAACAFDYDRDGNLDLFVASGYVVYGRGLEAHPDRLYRGDGKGGFVDMTQRVGLLTATAPGKMASSKPTYGAAHGDFDGDGWQDLWVCTYGRQWNHLWRYDPKRAAFANVGKDSGFRGDAVTHGRYPAWLKKFWKKKYGSERQDEQPFRANGNTFDCAIADYDNDGDMDCILAEITHLWAGDSSDRTSLLVNQGGKFQRRADAFSRRHVIERWNQGDIHAGWIDFDNDGLLDALIASSDYPDRQELRLFRQRPDHTFEAPRTFSWEGAGQISVGDYDNDGDQDILCGRSLNRLPKDRRKELGKSCALFRNEVGNKNHWLQVVCTGKSGKGGKGANRDGIGCRIRVTTADGVTQTREIRGGLGHAGHNGPYVAHFGLGAHKTAARVEVVWPDAAGSRRVLKDQSANRRLQIEQR